MPCKRDKECNRGSFLYRVCTALNSLLSEKPLTLSPPSTTQFPYANSLDPDEMPSNSASYPDPSFLTLMQHLFPSLSNIEALRVLK